MEIIESEALPYQAMCSANLSASQSIYFIQMVYYFININYYYYPTIICLMVWYGLALGIHD